MNTNRNKIIDRIKRNSYYDIKRCFDSTLQIPKKKIFLLFLMGVKTKCIVI